MAHKLGGTSLPLIGADGLEPRSKGAAGAPWIGTLLEGFALTIEQQCGAAWASLAPREPICKTRVPFNPFRYKFQSQWLPGLFLWVDRTAPTAVERIAAGVSLRTRELNLLWMPPPAQGPGKAENWAEFWVALDGAIELAVNTPFSPWTTEDALGPTLQDAADLWKLELGQGGEQPIQLEGVPSPFEGYQWKLTAQQQVVYDPAAQPAPVSPNKIYADVANAPGTLVPDGIEHDPNDYVLAIRLPQSAWQ
jgi:hypothetical protein